MVVDALDDVLRPGLHVLRSAALEHHQDSVAAESAAQIGRRQLSAHQFRELRHEILAREDSDRILNIEEAIGLDVRKLANAALDGMGATLADRRNQVALLEKSRRGVVLDRIGELYLEIVILLVVRRYADARGRLVLVIGPGQRQYQR